MLCFANAVNSIVWLYSSGFAYCVVPVLSGNDNSHYVQCTLETMEEFELDV